MHVHQEKKELEAYTYGGFIAGNLTLGTLELLALGGATGWLTDRLANLIATGLLAFPLTLRMAVLLGLLLGLLGGICLFVRKLSYLLFSLLPSLAKSLME